MKRSGLRLFEVLRKGSRRTIVQLLEVRVMAMIPKAGYYTPLLHVNSIEESMRFYALLGFEADPRPDGGARSTWMGQECTARAAR